jgi:cobyrinic acid a,c-diamide synthase
MTTTTTTTPRGLVVAGTRSGCGKTSVALGIMRALTRRGHVVQAFKVGPDFIDPGHHSLATGRASHNLDDWMCGPAGMRDIFARYAAGADMVVVEGVMGLFDGYLATDEIGSTARLAKLLGLPVLLVADAASMARSVAAMVGGYLAFDPDLTFCGVALNNAGSDSHAALLQEAMAAALPDVPLWAVLSRHSDLAVPSRHLGLVTAEDAPPRLDALADWIESSCDLSARLDTLPPLILPPHPGGPGGMIPPGGVQGQRPWQGGPGGAAPLLAAGGSPSPLLVGIARDRAFCFYYAENLRHLETAGARLVEFSPLEDAALPEGLAGLYLGGGYPELHARRLSDNAPMRRSIRAFCEAGRPVLAECGGFMYLMQGLTDPEGKMFPMAGVFPYRAVMGQRFSALGYREVTTRAGTLLGPAGTTVRGHEFHYSRLEGNGEDVAAVYAMTGRVGAIDTPEGFLRGRTLGSYVHLHFGGNPQVAAHFIAACAEGR